MPELKIPFEGHELNLLIVGEPKADQAPLFVLPGGPGFGYEIYYPTMSQLQDCAQLIFFDPPGCGESLGYPDESLDMEQYIRAMEAIRKHLGIEKISLIGTSYGAMVAFEYLVRYPQHTAKTITIGGATSHRFIELAKRNIALRGDAEQQAICEELLWFGQFLTQDRVNRFFAIMTPLYSITTPKGAPSAYQVSFCAAASDNAWRTRFWNFDTEPRLAAVTSPVLSIWGKEDWVNDPSFGDIVKQHIPHARVEIIEGSGHSVSRDKKDVLLRLVREFLQTPEPQLSVPSNV